MVSRSVSHTQAVSRDRQPGRRPAAASCELRQPQRQAAIHARVSARAAHLPRLMHLHAQLRPVVQPCALEPAQHSKGSELSSRRRVLQRPLQAALCAWQFKQQSPAATAASAAAAVVLHSLLVSYFKAQRPNKVQRHIGGSTRACYVACHGVRQQRAPCVCVHAQRCAPAPNVTDKPVFCGICGCTSTTATSCRCCRPGCLQRAGACGGRASVSMHGKTQRLARLATLRYGMLARHLDSPAWLRLQPCTAWPLVLAAAPPTSSAAPPLALAHARRRLCCCSCCWLMPSLAASSAALPGCCCRLLQ